ncbi:YcdB/YcdC domain-containing protein [Paenibacillus thalictri]|uniref:YcdB/YcdC repeated domain-containing protein n=1 Tax=Paenibacillus thalictri TaxID=2527873 RepID=A0A4Q9DK50_9BACL|nr:YcdB/YcdC domain-containing protein [Paenibacillus thalictri]TBL72432.1 hypothetical protein EYB31_29055 [Paenibacillus thalictri]
MNRAHKWKKELKRAAAVSSLVWLALGTAGVSASGLPEGAAAAALQPPNANCAAFSLVPEAAYNTETAADRSGDEELAAQPDAEEAYIAEEKAVELSRMYAHVPDSYRVTEAKIDYLPASYYVNSRRQIDPYHRGPARWFVSFGQEGGGTPVWTVNLDAATGRLLTFYHMEPDGGQPDAIWPKLTYSEAEKLAGIFIAGVSGDIVSELKDDKGRFSYEWMMTTDPQDDALYGYHFTANRLVNGIPFPQNNVNLRIDPDGTIVEFNRNWDAQFHFQDPQCAVPTEAAYNVFQDQIRLTFQIPLIDADRTPMLIYDQRPDIYLNAATAAITDSYGRTDPQVAELPLSNEPLAAIEGPAGEVTQEKAAAFLQTMLHIPDSAEIKVNAIEMDAGSAWTIEFSLGTEGSAHAVVDKQSGRPTYFQIYKMIKDGTPVIARAQAQAAAEQFLRTFAGAAVHELYPEKKDPTVWPNEDENNIDYGFSYRRIAGPERIDLGEVTVRVNKFTGEINALTGGDTLWMSADIPHVLGLKQAQALYMAHNKPELIYFAPYTMRCDSSNYEKSKACAQNTDPEIQNVSLYYRWKWDKDSRFAALDAVTGEWIRRGTRNVLNIPQQEKTGNAPASQNEPESVQVQGGRAKVLMQRPETPEIPQAIRITKELPFYSSPDETQKPDGTISAQQVQVIRADTKWYNEGKHWYQVSTWLGDKWIHAETGKTAVPRLPVYLTLHTNTPIYAAPDSSLQPSAELTPQDVIVADAGADWYKILADPGEKRWVQIRTFWLGDQWIQYGK